MTTKTEPESQDDQGSASSLCSSFCSRSACQVSLTDECVRIWNNPGVDGGYRDYCHRCGWKIIQFNRESKDDIQLRYEVLLPFRNASIGARFRYPNSNREWVKVSDDRHGIIAEYSEKYMQFGSWGGQQYCSAKDRVEDKCCVWVFA